MNGRAVAVKTPPGGDKQRADERKKRGSTSHVRITCEDIIFDNIIFVGVWSKHLRIFFGRPRQSSVILVKCSETFVWPSKQFEKIFGKWSEIFGKSSKTSSPLSLNIFDFVCYSFKKLSKHPACMHNSIYKRKTWTNSLGHPHKTFCFPSSDRPIFWKTC